MHALAMCDAVAPDESGLSRLESVAETADGDHVARIRRIDLDLHAQSAHMHIDESAVTEVVVVPHLL
jgi:hypothetical protein